MPDVNETNAPAFEEAKKKRDRKHYTKEDQEAAVKECEEAEFKLKNARNARN